MKPFKLLKNLAGLAGAFHPPQAVLQHSAQLARIPTSNESAAMGRRILALSKLATFSTVFPISPDSYSDVEALELGGVPIGLMEYIADCEDDGNPTVLAIKIGTSFRNVDAGSNISISLRWIPPYSPSRRISLISRLFPFISHHSIYPAYPAAGQADPPDAVPYSATNLPRFALFGHLEPVTSGSKAREFASCYIEKHPDAKYWLPGNPVHKSEWMRFVVTGIYWIGGFGDRAYIGWIPLEEWKGVTRDRWQSIRLPGEKEGWSEWSVGFEGEL